MDKANRYKIAIMAVLLAVACYMTYYCHTVLRIEPVFTHLFYIPIFFASFWWKRKGLIVAVFLGGFLVLSHILLRVNVTSINDYFRAGTFLLVGFLIAMVSERIAKADEKIEHLNAVLRAIRRVEQLITKESDGERLLQGACNNFIETRGYHSIWIAVFDESNRFVMSAEAGLGEGFLPMLKRSKHSKVTRCGQRALAQSGVVCIEDPHSACTDCPLSKEYASRGAMTTRLEYKDKVYGLMSVSIPSELTEDKEEQELLSEIAGDIAFALHNIEQEEKRKQAEKALQQAHDELETRVEQRTTELTNTNEKLETEVTERKRTEEQLRNSRDYLDRILNGMYEGVIVIDHDYTIKDVNGRFLSQYNVSREDIIGRKCYEITHRINEPCTGTKHICPARNAFDTAEPMCAEHIHLKSDGSNAIVEIYAFPLFDKDGNVEFVVELTNDITERKQAQEEAQQRQMEMIHISKLSTVGEMASGLAHELNQPLSAITSYSTACMNTIKSGESQTETILDDLQMVVSQARRAGEIIQRIRDFLQKRSPHRSTVDINDLVESSMDFVASDTERHQIQLKVELSDQLAMVLADPIQLEQVFLNIVYNAIEAMAEMPPQKRLLTVQTRMQTDKNVEIVVCDSGKGLDDEVSEKMFDSFFTTKPEGLGMGLSISRTIIEAHNGMIFVKPGKAEGTEIVIQLPV